MKIKDMKNKSIEYLKFLPNRIICHFTKHKRVIRTHTAEMLVFKQSWYRCEDCHTQFLLTDDCGKAHTLDKFEKDYNNIL